MAETRNPVRAASSTPVALSEAELDLLSGMALEILQALVRLDTSNPPGNEIAAARYLQERLAAEGIGGEVIEPEPSRGNYVARLRAGAGAGPDEGLLLLSHLDVVPAEAERWRAPPFGGEVREGAIWGRGTIDTKNLTALQAAIMILLQRRGLPLRRDLVLAATADEEAGGRAGVKWLSENRYDLLRAGAAINEGGGLGLKLGPATAYLVQTTEKYVCPVTVTAHGTPGHASMPTDDNAVVHLSRALAAIGSHGLPMKVTETYRGFVRSLAAAFGGPAAALAGALLNPRLADAAIARLVGNKEVRQAFRAMTRNTATPTVVRAGYKINVIPGTASAELDCRVLPGSTPEDLVAELKAVLEPTGLGERVELSAAEPGVSPVESPFSGELVELMRSAIARHSAGAALAPFLSPGATDGRFLRPLGMAVYGFCPMLPGEAVTTAHGHDERLSLPSLRFGAQVLWDLITGYCVAGA